MPSFREMRAARMKEMRAKKKAAAAAGGGGGASCVVAVKTKAPLPQCDAMPLNAELFPVGRRVGLAYDARLLAHRMPVPPAAAEAASATVATDDVLPLPPAKSAHPECPERLLAIMRQLEEEGLTSRCIPLPARLATRAELALVHDEAYLTRMEGLRDDARDTPSGAALAEAAATFNSVYLCAESVRCAALATGAAVHAAEEVAAGRLESAAAVVRPPGHHAEPECAMGFCLYATVAVAARAAAQRGARVLVVDWDVHHGNGTQSALLRTKEILTFSIHRHDNGRFYPPGPAGGAASVGEGEGAGRNVNVAWNSKGMGDRHYASAWEEVLLPLAREWEPTLVIVAAGFDAARGDPLGGCDVTPSGFAHLLRALQTLPSVEGKVVLVLEGGYCLRSIAHCFAACVATLLGHPVGGLGAEREGTEEGRAVRTMAPRVAAGAEAAAGSAASGARRDAAARDAIAATIDAHRPYWGCFPTLVLEEEVEVAAAASSALEGSAALLAPAPKAAPVAAVAAGEEATDGGAVESQ